MNAAGPLASKGNSKFKILLQKIFCLEYKSKSNTPSYCRKKQILSLEESSLMFLQTIIYSVV